MGVNEPESDQAGGMSAHDLADLNRAWRRRCERVPASFGSCTDYMEAVGQGLLEREPAATYNTLSASQLVDEIEAAVSVPMPPWKPRPEGPSEQCLIGLARFAIRDRSDDGDDE